MASRRQTVKFKEEQFTGCILGLAMGDAMGAPYEGGILERLLWRLIGRTSDGRLRWTDDTQMAFDLATSLLDTDGVDADAIAQRFASSYRWSRGYGPSAARVLQRIRKGEPWVEASRSVYPEGSFGNGAAMRAPVLALFFPTDRKSLIEAAKISASITHAHPLGIEGTVLLALAAQALLQRQPIEEVLSLAQNHCATSEIAERLETIALWLKDGSRPSAKETAMRLGNGMTATTSCPTAVYIALRHLDEPFEEMMRFTIQCGGDVDTIGAMSGALWGIVNGAGRQPSVRLEARAELEVVARRLYERLVPVGGA